MNTPLLSKRAALALALFAAAAPALALPAVAESNKSVPAFDAFVKTFAEVKDYKDTLITHETNDAGTTAQDRTSEYRWRRNPVAAFITVLAGPGKGGVAVWNGGDTVSGHEGGFASFLHLTLNIHNSRATSLRGDTIETASFEYTMKHFLSTPGTMSEAAGPAIDGQASTAVSLAVSDPAKNGNVSKDLLYLSNVKHLPVRREEYVGPKLVKLETYNNVQTNVGLTDADFR